MIIGIGVDIASLKRFGKQSQALNRFAKRILTRKELESQEWTALRARNEENEKDGLKEMRGFLALRCVPVLLGVKGKSQSKSARRWAAKEAAYKALFPTFKPLHKDLSVLKASGKPFIALEDRFYTRETGLPRMHLSVSHDGDFLVASVVAETDPAGSTRSPSADAESDSTTAAPVYMATEPARSPRKPPGRRPPKNAQSGDTPAATRKPGAEAADPRRGRPARSASGATTTATGKPAEERTHSKRGPQDSGAATAVNGKPVAEAVSPTSSQPEKGQSRGA